MAELTSDGNTLGFYFTVDFGLLNSTNSFREVSGLDVIPMNGFEYKKGSSNVFSTIKMPGMKKSGKATLKNGVIINDVPFQEWYNSIKLNTIARTTITIQLRDESNQPTMTWVLLDAKPTKISVIDIHADNLEIETLELSYEGLTIHN